MSTFDDQYVISAGADGNLFVFKFNSLLEPPVISSITSVTDKVTNNVCVIMWIMSVTTI